MDVTVTDLRAHLSAWIDRARAGEHIVVTDRGLPVARLTGMDTTDLIERLTREGVISPPESPTKTKARRERRVRATGPVADLIGEMRREDLDGPLL
ncbi:MAG: type II toxin-antitoxin system Phd/YefM family antitoxin [Acidimicrobiales bacterium]